MFPCARRATFAPVLLASRRPVALLFSVALASMVPGSLAAAPLPSNGGSGTRSVGDGAYVEPRGTTALVTGLAIAGGSLGLGGWRLATQAPFAKHAGLYLMHGGLALAPFAAHGVVGEWWRGAAFSVPPALGGAGMVVLLSARPQAPVQGKKQSHRIYPVLIAVSVVGSALGVVDAAMIDDRAPRVAVNADRDSATALFEGTW